MFYSFFVRDDDILYSKYFQFSHKYASNIPECRQNTPVQSLLLSEPSLHQENQLLFPDFLNFLLTDIIFCDIVSNATATTK